MKASFGAFVRPLLVLCALVFVADIAAVFVVDRDPGGPCGSADPLDAKELLECLSASIVYITTPTSTGSGILLDSGYVVTNAHVIDPFASAGLTFPDGTKIEHAPVKGVDLLADVALLGPVEQGDGRTLADPIAVSELAKGDPVFLIGYPGETDSEPDVTISQGIVSRIRKAEPFGQTYVQTDAAIGGGQSGGALVDAFGNIVGISGLRFADEFALALSADDVTHSMVNITAGLGWPYQPLPDAGLTTEGAFHVTNRDDAHTLVLPPSDTDQQVHIDLNREAQTFVTAFDMFRNQLYLPPEFLDYVGSPDEVGMTQAQADHIRSVEDNDPATAIFDVPHGAVVAVLIWTDLDGGADISFHSSLPVSSYADTDDGREIAVGDRIEAVLDSWELQDTYSLHLTAGEVIDVYAGAPASDLAFSIQAPGQSWEDATFVDNSNEGLYGVDAHEKYTAAADGVYTVYVQVEDVDVRAVGYVLHVSTVPPAT